MNCPPARASVRFFALTTTVLLGALALSACSSGSGSAKGAAPTSAAISGGAAPATANRHVATITMSSQRCIADQPDYASGALTFKVSNTNATGVTEIELLQGERILAEKENLPPGFSGSFSLNVEPGAYTLYCPGAQTERVPLTITGAATSSAGGNTHDLLIEGTKTYASYVTGQVALLSEGVKALQATIARPQTPSSLAAAQTAYAKARVYYERVEPVAESFTTAAGSLDAAIDARADDVPLTKLTGFHRLEYGLFTAKTFAGLAPIAAKLVADVATLQKLSSNLTYQPAELGNGAVSLLDEVQKTKITGEEERYSHIDLVDLQANVEGSEQAFANLQPGLAKIDPALTGAVTAGFAALDAVLDKYRSSTTGTGFVSFSGLSTTDKQALSRAVQAVSEPLSKVAGKVVNS